MSSKDRSEWCLSSIPPGRLCPSNPDKSTQPWPLLSSSISSRLLISNTNNDNNLLNTDIISAPSLLFYSKEKDTVAYVLPSSLEYPYDYYTTKRIEQLHERMDDIQISSFLKFINYHLSTKKDHVKDVEDLAKDLSNGHILIDLIEIFSSKKLKREYGRTRFHSLTNVQYVLDYLKLHMQHINISPHDIVSGNRKQILALLWIIMKIFDFPSFRLTTNKHLFNENTLFSLGQDRSILIKWINNLLNKILNKSHIYVKDFYIQTWIDNAYLVLIIQYLSPLSSKYGSLEYFEYVKQLEDVDINNKQRLEFCLILSNYCFNTILIIDYEDRTEKSLFRYFCELQQNIFYILKSNQIGKLNKTNPFTKQLLETITSIEELQTNNDDQDYLIFDENEQLNLISESHDEPILTSNTTSIEEVAQQAIDQPENLEEPSVNMEVFVPPVIQEEEQQSCSQNISSSPIPDDPIQNIRPRKLKKKRSTLSLETLASISSTPNNDLFVKMLECFRDPKLIIFKYILILICLCFSIVIIFLHK